MSAGRASDARAPVARLDELLAGRHLPVFDGLRVVAVLLVVVDHAKVAVVPGDLGVSTFFVISGFLITWLLLREQDATGAVSLRDFYVRRTLRIFPAYYVFLAFSLLADTVLGDRWTSWRLAANLGYFTNYYNAVLGHPTNSTAHAWSLAVEEQFYLLWPFAFIALSRLGRPAMRRVLAWVVVAVAAWRTVAFVALGMGTAYGYNAFETRLDTLAIGCGLALWATVPANAERATRVARWWWAPLPTLVALYLSRMATPDWYHHGPGYTVDGLLIALAFVQLLQLHGRGPWRVLDLRPVRWLGTLSYPFYLYHLWGLGLGHKLRMLPPWGQFGAGLLATLAFGVGSYYVIERPMLALRDRFTGRTTRPLASGGTAA